MPGIIPNKGEGARAKATAWAKARYEEGEKTVKEIVEDMMARYEIAESTAYQYSAQARRELGIETVRDQLVIGMEATAAAMRVGRELEVLARKMATAAADVEEMEAVSKAFRRAGQQYLGTAQAAIRLDVGEAMSDQDQTEILAAAMAANRHKIPPKVRRDLAAQLLDEESVH